MNKKVLIGLGVLAVAGIGLYMWKRRKDGEKSKETKSNARGFMASATCPCYDKNGNYLGYDNENCCTIIETKSPSYSNARGFMASATCPCYDKNGNYLGYDNENCCTIIETKSPSYSNAGGRNVTRRFSPRLESVTAPIGNVGALSPRTFGGNVGVVSGKSAPMPVGGDCFYNCEKLSCPSCASGFYCKCPETSTI